MGVKNIYPVYFKSRGGIHTFFMLSPIDVVILDESNRVVKIAKSLKPNRLFFWNPRYENVLELAAGTINKNKMRKYKPAFLFR